MSKKFSTLREKMSPSARAKAQLKKKEMMAEMLLSEIRKEAGLTQKELAESLGIKQPSLSKLESQDDMQVSTLKRLVEALGGELEIIAHLPKGDLRIGQFKVS
jgi:transcriptional regulator with XRE-family HTH domain